jgi:hypothetical protein
VITLHERARDIENTDLRIIGEFDSLILLGMSPQKATTEAALCEARRAQMFGYSDLTAKAMGTYAVDLISDSLGASRCGDLVAA